MLAKLAITDLGGVLVFEATVGTEEEETLVAASALEHEEPD